MGTPARTVRASESTAAVVAEEVTRVLPGAVATTLVESVDLVIGAGEFVAITGPSGSGKSSLLYLLGLLDRPTSGRILLEGRDTGAFGRDEAAAFRLSRIGFVFQFHFLLPEFTVMENVMIPLRRLSGRAHGRLAVRAQDILESLGIAALRDRRPDQLSGGERQRAAIARALANDPPIVLADEPTGNLDSHNADLVFSILGELAAKEGRTVIAVTHDAALAARAGRRVGLVDGRIVADSGPSV
ncbi:MAG: ABC transporter ATP-binding protein [Rhodospirillales bacterium]|nr:ABC transporter ATP-binding protein [Rhodospirillales bacterium]